VLQGQSNDTKSLQGAYDDVFMQYQVDFTTYGHIHVYSRCVFCSSVEDIPRFSRVNTVGNFLCFAYGLF